MVRIISLMCAFLYSSQAFAALYWQLGVRTSQPISVCFVGNATTARPDRVAQVMNYLREYSYAANIQFRNDGKCAASVVQSNGNDFFAGDIRVVLPSTDVSGTGQVPGNGCPMFMAANGTYNGGNDTWGSWSNAPNDLAANRGCMFNLKLGDDPWSTTRAPYLNHTLHEFGHALGLSHEHERADANKTTCTESGYGGGGTAYMTPYDTASVMHYEFLSCSIAGNYGDSGLSAWDKLAVHILYPENELHAEYDGTLVIPQGKTLQLTHGWQSRGANMSFVAPITRWYFNNSVITNTQLTVAGLAPGEYPLSLWYQDFLGRWYSHQTTVRVLTSASFKGSIAGAVATLF